MPDDPKPFDFGFPSSPGGAWPAIMGDPGSEESGDSGGGGGTSTTGWTTITKLSNLSRQSVTAVADDPDLSFLLSANQKVRIRAMVVFTTPAAADFNYAWNGPASPVFWGGHCTVTDGNGAFANTNPVTTPGSVIAVLTPVDNVPQVVRLDLVIHNGVNVANFRFQWAQFASVASNTTVYAGSYIEYRRI